MVSRRWGRPEAERVAGAVGGGELHRLRPDRRGPSVPGPPGADRHVRTRRPLWDQAGEQERRVLGRVHSLVTLRVAVGPVLQAAGLVRPSLGAPVAAGTGRRGGPRRAGDRRDVRLAAGDGRRGGSASTPTSGPTSSRPARSRSCATRSTPALLAYGLGSAALTPNPVSLAGLALSTVGLKQQVRLLEEPHLLQLHGDDYLSWSARVGRFVPFVGRRPSSATVRSTEAGVGLGPRSSSPSKHRHASRGRDPPHPDAGGRVHRVRALSTLLVADCPGRRPVRHAAHDPETGRPAGVRYARPLAPLSAVLAQSVPRRRNGRPSRCVTSSNESFARLCIEFGQMGYHEARDPDACVPDGVVFECLLTA